MFGMAWQAARAGTTMLLAEHDEDSMDDSAWGPIKLARIEQKLGLSVYPYASDFAGGMQGITMRTTKDE